MACMSSSVDNSFYVFPFLIPTTMKTVNERLQDLREVMRREHLAAFIFPSTDPHQGEYVPDHWKGREFISGFNGSAGTAVVTMNSAALWTDSRYFLAAEEQLRGTEFQLMKLKMPGTPTIAQWIGQELFGSPSAATPSPSTEVGIDGWCSSTSEVKELMSDLRREGGITLRTNFDPLKAIWKDRPAIPENPVELFPIEYAGEHAHDKIARIRQALRERHADGMLMSALDDIAWTLNLRGTDVHCNPLFVSYLLMSTTSVTLYINKEKLTPAVVDYLKKEGVEVEGYDQVANGLRRYFEYNILLDPNETNYALYDIVRKKGQLGNTTQTEMVEEESPVRWMKTVKNPTEIAGFKSAMLKDGIAMVKFLKWLDDSFATHKTQITEISIAQKLAALRAEQPLFRDISFDTIAGYGPHGAIVHYEATPETDIPLQPRGLLLVDSGAQYLDGTTDITRTVALGPLTHEEKKVYTLVLKGHLQLQHLVFPDGAAGTQLDAIARAPLWREGLNYLHGTGHGVGSYLCVHEGPHQIRMEWKPTPLRAAMTVTCEPGIYVEGRFGVRIENTLLIVPATEPTPSSLPASAIGSFLRFEPLTLCPIDKRPIIVEDLSEEERQWLNEYHKMVYDRLAPHLTPEEVEWLAKACAPVS